MSICTELKDLVAARLPEILALRADRRGKADGSYVTGGDLLVDGLMSDYLERRLPGVVVVSEERTCPPGAGQGPGVCVVIDPIDGTENFTSGLLEWGAGVSVYENGRHRESMLFLPEMGIALLSGQKAPRHRSRVRGFSSSTRPAQMTDIRPGDEYRVMGCSMLNMYYVVTGAFRSFTNPAGANVWDILPGLNLALENGLAVEVNEHEYRGEFLPIDRRHRFKISNG